MALGTVICPLLVMVAVCIMSLLSRHPYRRNVLGLDDNHSLPPPQRLINILGQILDILDAGGDPYQPIVYPQPLAVRG